MSWHIKNQNDHRSGGAVKEGCPYLCIKHIIKLIEKKCLFINICVNCTIRRMGSPAGPARGPPFKVVYRELTAPKKNNNHLYLCVLYLSECERTTVFLGCRRHSSSQFTEFHRFLVFSSRIFDVCFFL